jgi:hypothetical protein
LKPKPILQIRVKSILRIDAKPIRRIGIAEHVDARLEIFKGLMSLGMVDAPS